MTTTTTTTQPMEASGSPERNLYVLFYRQGQNPHPQELHFYYGSFDMRVVVERVKRHCECMNYRFVNVRPFFTDLDKEENVILNKE